MKQKSLKKVSAGLCALALLVLPVDVDMQVASSTPEGGSCGALSVGWNDAVANPSCKPHTSWYCIHPEMPEPLYNYCDPDSTGC